MPYSSDHDGSLPARHSKPDPFASLNEHAGHRRRFWLFELLLSPFQDHDERASYHLAGKAARNAEGENSGIRVSKAWNGNGNPSGGRRPTQATAQAGFASMPAREDGLFSSADRRPAGH